MPDLAYGTHRRRILKALGTGIIAAGGMTGLASAKKNTCPPGKELLAKFEVKGGEFVFEEGYENESDVDDNTYSLNVSEEDISTNILKRKNDGGILKFEFDASPFYAEKIRVKAANEVYTKEINEDTGTFDITNFEEDRPIKAVSNFVLCKDVYWQVDFGEGPTETPPEYDDPEDPKPTELILAALSHNGLKDGSLDNPSFGPADSPNGEDITITTDTDGDGSPEFSLSGGNGGPQNSTTSEITAEIVDQELLVHFAAWELPGPYMLGEVNQQGLYDEDVRTYKGTQTLNVSLPTE